MVLPLQRAKPTSANLFFPLLCWKICTRVPLPFRTTLVAGLVLHPNELADIYMHYAAELTAARDKENLFLYNWENALGSNGEAN